MKYVEKAIRSILDQTHSDLEVLICDDGSTDQTRAVIDGIADPRIIAMHNEQNKGNVYTRNKLFAKATGDYICIQDADDWSAPDRIERQLEALKTSNTQVSASNFYRVKKEKKETTLSSRENIILPGVRAKFPFALASILLSKEVYDDIGPIPNLLERIYAEDNYWVTLINEKYPIAFLHEPLYYYRDNIHSLTNEVNLNSLVAIPLITELKKQRVESGTDWVETGNSEAINQFKKNLLSDNTWLGETLLKKAINIAHKNPVQAKEAVRMAREKLGSKMYLMRTYWKYVKASLIGKLSSK